MHQCDLAQLLYKYFPTAPRRVSALRSSARVSFGHLRQERLGNALSSDYARQRKRDALARIVGANREYRALISQHDLGDARGDHADAVLARANRCGQGDPNSR